MMLFLAGSMTHAYDAAKIELGFKNARYHWPAFAGDTFKKAFKVKSLRNTSDKKKSIFTIECQLFNQRQKPLFSVEKTMIFPFEVAPSDVNVQPSSFEYDNSFLHHIVDQSENVQQLGSQTLQQASNEQQIVVPS